MWVSGVELAPCIVRLIQGNRSNIGIDKAMGAVSFQVGRRLVPCRGHAQIGKTHPTRSAHVIRT